jgi:hypothetical protein
MTQEKVVRLESLRLEKEAQKCQLAAEIAKFLEGQNIPQKFYEFIMTDMINFYDELVLVELRELPRWKQLEQEFKKLGGFISEDWDMYEEDNTSLLKSSQMKSLNQAKTKKKEFLYKKPVKINLILLTLLGTAFIGMLTGWFFPYFNLFNWTMSSSDNFTNCNDSGAIKAPLVEE